jgi:hypothetical protein
MGYSPIRRDIMKSGEHILIIDDDEKLCRLVEEYLGPMKPSWRATGLI